MLRRPPENGSPLRAGDPPPPRITPHRGGGFLGNLPINCRRRPRAREARCADARGTSRPRRGPGAIDSLTGGGGWGVGGGVLSPSPPRRAEERVRGRGRSARLFDLAGWLRADVARALGRPRSAIHGCRSLLGCDVKEITGSPDPKHISTSYVERQNLTMRMSMRWFTRLTNAFSKKVENHAAAIALYFMYYNFGRVHQTLRVTPAMEAGVANHVWNIEEIVTLLG